jgi:hypothetical protein
MTITAEQPKTKRKFKFRLMAGQHIQTAEGFVPNPSNPYEDKKQEVYQARPDLDPPVFPIIETDVDLTKHNIGGNIKFQPVELAPTGLSETSRVWDMEHESLEQFVARMDAERAERQGKAQQQGATMSEQQNQTNQKAALASMKSDPATVQAAAAKGASELKARSARTAEQMTEAELRDLCDQYDVQYSKNAGKTELIKNLKAKGLVN